MRSGAQRQAIEKLPPEDRKTVQAAMEKVPQHMTSELNVLLGQKKNRARDPRFPVRRV